MAVAVQVQHLSDIAKEGLRPLYFADEPVGKDRVIGDLVHSRDDDDGKRGPDGAQLPGQLCADEAGHDLIGQHEIDMMALEQIERLCRGDSGKNGVATLDEHHLPQRSRYVFVVDTKYDRAIPVHNDDALTCSRYEQLFFHPIDETLSTGTPG